MYITDENVLSVGLVDENGHEPDDPMYARQPIALRWDPSNDEEVFVNVEEVVFPRTSRRWHAVSAVLCVNRTNVLLLDIPIGQGGMTVDVTGQAYFSPRHLSFRRDALVNKYGDYRLHLAITEKRPVGMHENRLVNDELILEWPRRPKRNREVVGYDCEFQTAFPAELPEKGNNPLADLYRQRYGDYMPRELVEKTRRLAKEQAMEDAALREAKRRMDEALAEKLERHGSRPTGELFGVDAAAGAPPWQSAIPTPLTKEKLREAFKKVMGIPIVSDETMPKNQAEIRAYSDQAPYGELIPGRKLVITNIGAEQKPKPAERKIIVPVPRFWGQLDQALNAPKKAAPPKEMPVVEPTPAGAEELIDWARADESRAAWAEKLSIPRVTRMLKEMTSYGKTWSESDLVALSGG